MLKIGALMIAAFVGYIFYHNLPDLQRYMRIKAM